MKIGLLLSERVQQLSGELGCYSSLFLRLFSAYTPQLSLEIYDVRSGIYPKTIHACDGYIGTGSICSVYEQEPWILELSRFLKVLHEKEKKYVGICFGHQIIAQALAGRCERAENGWGLGVRRIEVCKKKRWMEPFLPSCKLIFSHQDQITALPANAEILGRAEHCPCGIIGVGEHFLGIQAHPEFTPAFALALLDRRRDRISPPLAEAATATLAEPTDEPTVARWIANFFNTRGGRAL